MAPHVEELLLPGVQKEVPQPRGYSGALEIRGARWRANLRDAFDLLLLLGVDFIFFNWPWTHVPLLSRTQSQIVIVAANVLIVGSCALSRRFPEWRARRIASTWRPVERKRFTSGK